MRLFFILLAIGPLYSPAIQVIDNGLAPPEIVHTPSISVKPRCKISAPPLDLVFILDSSGSLRDKFQDEVDIIRRIVKHVTIGLTATRVMLVQFSGTQHLEFDFNKFHDRDELLAALDVLRHVSGITRIGEAFEFTMKTMLNVSNGMRDSSVPKILYILSDGRTHDYPKDWQMADLLRSRIPNVDIWAYGTGDYVAIEAIKNYTRSEKKIVTNQNLKQLEPQFDPYKGTEICEKIPSCIKGSDKPLDLMLLVDASQSLDSHYKKQIDFAIDRVLARVNVNPIAVRISLITYSGTFFVHFTFNSLNFYNNTAIEKHLRSLRSIKGTTSTHLALQEALRLLTSTDPNVGTRQGVPKMVLVLTDGHSQRSPAAISKKIRELGITTLAVSITPRPGVDEAELLMIAGDKSRVFTPDNLQDFESEFTKYIGFGCEGIELDKNSKPLIRGATDIFCDESSLTLVVRTQREMSGLVYSQSYHDDPRCMKVTNGATREISITFHHGTCGVTKTKSDFSEGYNFNVTVILQFHPLIMTRADQGLEIGCFLPQKLTQQERDQKSVRMPADTSCSYRLHRYSPEQCVALDAKVGEALYHKWQCDAPPDYKYLVHDCFVDSERNSMMIIDSEGCEIDPHFLETPNYSKFSSNVTEPYVYQEMSVFKFPGDDNISYKCLISLCNMNLPDSSCAQSIPPRCSKRRSPFAVRNKRDTQSPTRVERRVGRSRDRRQIVVTKAGFYMTLQVETRMLNVLLSESIRRKSTVKYCDIL